MKGGCIAASILFLSLICLVLVVSFRKARNPVKKERITRIDDFEEGTQTASGPAQEPVSSALSAFSLQSSFDDLSELRTLDIAADPQDLKMLDFFRVLCLIWVLCFGVCQFTMSGSAYNPWTLQTYFQTVAYTLVYSSNMGFDEFFMLSSFFAYLRLRQYYLRLLRDKGAVTLDDAIAAFAYRYARLAPAFYAVFLFGWLIGPYLNDGPWWFTYQMGFCDCQHYWWSVLVMTINFFPGYMVANEGCYYWSWFVACEIQLFLLLIPLVYLLAIKLEGRPVVVNVLLFCLIVLGTVISYIVLLNNDMNAGLFAPQDIIIFKIWLNKPYTKLHCIAWGFIMARLFLKIDEVKRQTGNAKALRERLFWGRLNSSWVAGLVTLIAFGVLAFISIYPLSANKDPSSWPAEKSAVYVSTSRNAFLICLILIFTVMWLDFGKFLKHHFSRQLWCVLSKLSFTVYLAFPVMASLFNSSMDSPLYLTYNEMFFQLIFSIGGSFFAAFILYMLIEAPFKNFLNAKLKGRKWHSIREPKEQKTANPGGIPEGMDCKRNKVYYHV